MKILSFIFILCLLASNGYGGQPEKKKKFKPKRTDNYIHMRGIRFGMDGSRPFQSYWTKGDRYGSEFSADMELWPNLLPVFETGYEFMKIKSNYIDYQGNGSYSRIGIDYNLLQATNIKDKDELFVGLRYGFAFAHQQVNQYQIDTYWGNETGRFGNQNYSGHWGEIVFGMKGELLHNFYMGWTIHGKFKFNNKNLGMPPAFFIPGYGNAGKGFNMDFSYSVYYNIPWDFRKSIGVRKTVTKNLEQKKTDVKKPATNKVVTPAANRAKQLKKQ
jgi:hypothetical protein